MLADFYVGKRVSYAGHPCTVRFVGEVRGTRGAWLGIEWDDPSKGKHAGEHDGMKYFTCLSSESTAGSFVRLTRPTDQPLSFLDALQKKYASETSTDDATQHDGAGMQYSIEIGGKIVEEVGFERIRQRLATLQELRVVILDGLCIGGVLDRPCSRNEQDWKKGMEDIELTSPKIVELDLSRNLIEQWHDVVGICAALSSIKSLKVNGNRFRGLSASTPNTFRTLKQLDLDETFLTWPDIISITTSMSALTALSASSNNVKTLPSLRVSLPPTLTTLTLDSNGFTTLSDLASLVELPSLKTISVRFNAISAVYHPGHGPFSFPMTLTTLDLTHNLIPTYLFISALAPAFPGLTSLRCTHNPFYNLDADGKSVTASLLTTARLSMLKTLNYSRITAAERTNAELYYLSTIASSLATVDIASEQERQIIDKHPRYSELCALYGEPNITRKPANPPHQKTLAARLIDFEFSYSSSSPPDGKEKMAATKPGKVIVKTLRIPRTFHIYRLKGIVGRMFEAFGLKSTEIRLLWETGQRDLVGEKEEDEGWSCSENEDDIGAAHDGVGVKLKKANGERDDGWKKREVELLDGTREVGFWIEGNEATIKVERIGRG